MRKFLTPVLLLLIGALITAMAFLPQITAAVMDSANHKSGAAPMQSIELEFGDEDRHSAEYLLSRLALEDNMHTIPITPEEASMTEEEVLEAIETQLQDYIAAGIYESFTPTVTTVEVILGLDPYATDNYGIIWCVNLVREGADYRNLFLHVDDETGRILHISYETYGEDRYGYYPEYQDYVIDTLAGNFFSQLGLAEYLAHMDGVYMSDIAATSECREVRYTFIDAEHGETSIHFVVYPNGFYTYYRD